MSRVRAGTIGGTETAPALFQSEKFHDDFGQDQLVIELRADELHVRIQRRFQSGNQLCRGEAMRVLRRDAERVTTD